MQIPSLYLGSFNSEQLWREPDISQLPAIADPQADAIVSVMDELQVVFCNSPQHVLITRMPMDPCYKDYVGSLGFSFSHNQLPLVETELAARSRRGICELLLSASRNSGYQDLLTPLSLLSPYSVEPFTEKLCQHYRLQGPNLDIEIVKKVNSKIFSHQLAKQFFPTTVGEIVRSASDLQEIGDRLLQSSPFLIKDEFGVSGKGNLLIDSSQVLQRIVAYIAKQEREGKRTQFLLEPLLDKQTAKPKFYRFKRCKILDLPFLVSERLNYRFKNFWIEQDTLIGCRRFHLSYTEWDTGGQSALIQWFFNQDELYL
jgi:hypothetical protein